MVGCTYVLQDRDFYFKNARCASAQRRHFTAIIINKYAHDEHHSNMLYVLCVHLTHTLHSYHFNLGTGVYGRQSSALRFHVNKEELQEVQDEGEETSSGVANEFQSSAWKF